MKTGTKVKTCWTILLVCVSLVSSFDFDCPENKHTCDRHKCIPSRWVCDGAPDCNDGTDEHDCSETPAAVECKSSYFKCENSGQCIPRSWKCDGNDDCGDESDEKPEDCEHICTESEFKCGDGQCIDNKWRCDGRPDCADQSDETNCSTYTTTLPFDRFHCKDGYSIPIKWVCDGTADCADQSDEMNCTSAITPTTAVPIFGCLTDEFQCPNSFCINNKWRCNGLKDCLNGEDEHNCPARKCEANEFRCEDGPCMRMFYRCNGERDCLDGSDEANCTKATTTPLPTTTVEVTTSADPCNSSGSFKCSDQSCIRANKVCNGFRDCPNNEDESEAECGLNECKNNNGGCVHSCIDTRIGYHCGCDEGYRRVGKYNCEDIDECAEVPGICSQSCRNTKGGFRCSCLEGYMKDPANYTRCRATEGEVLLLFSHSFDIRQLRLRDQEMKSVIGDTRNAIALDYSFTDGDIFWAEKKDRKILRSNLHKSMERQVLLSHQDVSADGLAVDWIHRTLYFTDNARSTVNLASLDKPLVKTIVHENMTHPRAIVVSPLAGFIYWTDWGHDPKIERAELDGSNRLTLISDPKNVRWPNGLTIDHPAERLFWCDGLLKTIFSSDLDGQNVEVVLYSTDFLNHPFSITVFEDRLYWTDWSRVALFSADKFTGAEIKSVSAGHMLEAPRVVHVYHQFRQPAGHNVCAQHSCEHFCLRNAEGKAFCACADGYVTNHDPVTCIKEELFLATEKTPAIITSTKTTSETQEMVPSAAPIRCTKNSKSVELMDLEIVESASMCETETSNVGYLLGGSIASFVVLALLIAGVIFWSKSSNQGLPFKRIFFPNPVYRRTTEDYSDGRGLIIGHDRMTYKPTEDGCTDHFMTEADDAPLTANTGNDMV